jgi:uncharacterized membrane protein YhaH (DUF805 family)
MLWGSLAMGFIHYLFGFQGRINRLQYWSGCGLVGILNFLGLFLAIGPALAAGDLSSQMLAMGAGSLILIPLRLAAGWIGLALQWKRFHDRGKSGWLSLIMFAPLVALVGVAVTADVENPAASFGMLLPLLGLTGLIGVWFFIELCLLPGQPEANRFGDPPGAGLQVGRPGSRGGPIDWDAATRPPAASSWAGVEAALEQAIAERRQAPRPQAPEPAMGRPMPRRAATTAPAPGGFGRRGL